MADDVDENAVLLDCLPPAGQTYDSFAFQARLVDPQVGPWIALRGRVYPLHPFEMPLKPLIPDYGPGLPEVVRMEVHCRYFDGDGVSDWGTPIPYTRGPRRPTIRDFAGSGGPGWWVGWENRSAVADRILLERSTIHPTGDVTPWIQIPVDGVPTYAVDELAGAIPDGGVSRYRVSCFSGEAQSAYAKVESGPMRPYLPTGLSTQPSPGGGSVISWTNHSRFATEIDVQRAPWKQGWFDPYETVAVLPPGAQGHVDVPAVPGVYRYLASPRIPTNVFNINLAGYPPPVIGASALPPGPGWLAVTQYESLPHADFATRTAAGAWVLTDSYGVAPDWKMIVLVQEGTGWSEHLLPGGGSEVVKVLAPGAIIDGAGAIHVFYEDLRPIGVLGSPYPVVHEWMDGTGWHREDVAARHFPDFAAGQQAGFAALGADGAMHLVWMAVGGYEYATNAGGTWCVEPIESVGQDVYDPGWYQVRVTAGADGVPRLLLLGPGRLVTAWKSAGGWTAEDVPPVGALPSRDVSGLLAIYRAPGRTSLVVQPVSSADGADIWVVDRLDTGWSAPYRVGASSTFLPYAQGVAAAAMSTDGNRLAVWWDGPSSRARIRDETGWTDFRTYGVDSGLPIAGFTRQNKFWALTGLRFDVQVLFEER